MGPSPYSAPARRQRCALGFATHGRPPTKDNVSNLFPVKLLHLFTEMKDAGVLAKLARGAEHLPVQAPDDGLTRLLLCSPEVQQVVASGAQGKPFRVRIAVPSDLDFLRLAELAQFEVYGADGEPMQAPARLVDLDQGLANAIQVELFHEVLRAKGSSIPLL